jgi:hypothetical protein
VQLRRAVASDDGVEGLGNKVPDDAQGISLEDWTDTHVCLDEATTERIRALANDALEIRDELLPVVRTKIERLCRTSVKVACASFNGDPDVLTDLAGFEAWMAHVREQLDELDRYLQLDPPPEPHLRLVPGGVERERPPSDQG